MRNSVYEQALTKAGVAWEYVEKIRLEEIDKGKGLKNQARLTQPIDEDHVVRLMAARKDGYELPALVIYRPTSRGKYGTIDGNHRHEALDRLDVKVTDAYVVDCQDPLVVNRLTWTFNNIVNGKRLSDEECLAHAVTMVRVYNMTAREAAREWQISPQSLMKTLKAEEVKDAIAAQGAKLVGEVSEDKLYRLGPLLDLGQDVVAKAAEVVINNGLTSETVLQLSRDVRKAKTNEDKLKVIDDLGRSEEARAMKAITKGGKLVPAKKSPRELMLARMEDLHGVLSRWPEAAALRPLPHEMQEAREVGRSIIRSLTRVLTLGAVPPEAREEAV